MHTLMQNTGVWGGRLFFKLLSPMVATTHPILVCGQWPQFRCGRALAACMMTVPMECHCISATQIPRTTRLYSSYLNDFGSLAEFFAHPPTLDSVLRTAGETPMDRGLRTKVAAILRTQNRAFGADAALEASLDQFAAGAATIVSGQQVGLFSGPSYTIYKALSALRLAEELRRAGKSAVAMMSLTAIGRPSTGDNGLPER